MDNKKHGIWNIFLREQHDQPPSYRIVQLPSDEDPRVYFRLTLKNIIVKLMPEEIMRSNFLLGFSKADIAVISHLGTKKELEKQQSQAKPKLFARIVQQLFGVGGKTKFMLKMPEQEQLVEAVPEEVMTNKEALGMLESHEAAMIGYAAAENRFMEIRKQTSFVPTCRLIKHDLLSNEVTYLDLERDNQHTLSLEQVFYNKDLLCLFPKVDQQMISFVSGEAHAKRLTSDKVTPTLKILAQKDDLIIYEDAMGNECNFSTSELAFNEALLNQFNQKDRDAIRFAAGELHQKRINPKKQVRFKLVSYAGKQAEYRKESGEVIEADFLELAFEPGLLDQFNQEDRDMIRFAAGELSKEKEAALRVKKY